MNRIFQHAALLPVAFLLALPASAQERSSNATTLSLPSVGGDGHLFFLDIARRVLTTNPDGSALRVLAEGLKDSPDGIDVDEARGIVYWSNMGRAADDDGSVLRVGIDGGPVSVVVPRGGTFT